MAALLGLEDSGKPCNLQAWEMARTQMDTHAFDMMRHGLAEILELWPLLSAGMRSAVLEIVRSGKERAQLQPAGGG
jgi:hypothetical protein